MSAELEYNRGGILPAGSTRVKIHPNEHIVKVDPSGAPLCVRAGHAGRECADAWWDARINVWRKIQRK